MKQVDAQVGILNDFYYLQKQIILTMSKFFIVQKKTRIRNDLIDTYIKLETELIDSCKIDAKKK